MCNFQASIYVSCSQLVPVAERLLTLILNCRKGISFLSRIIPGRKRGLPSDAEDDASEPDTTRMDANSSSQHIGFIPRFPRPPRYLRVKAHYKKEKTFNKVFIAQELGDTDEPPNPLEKPSSVSSITAQHHKPDGKAVWAMVFSNDGRYLAAAGQDKKVRVWAVISSIDDRNTAELEGRDAQDDDEPPRLKAPVFKTKPIQVYEGHTGSILDLSWSKVWALHIINPFRLSSQCTEQFSPLLVNGQDRSSVACHKA